MPNDIKSSAISAICEIFFTPTAEVIEELAKKNRLFCPKEKRFESKKVKKTTDRYQSINKRSNRKIKTGKIDKLFSFLWKKKNDASSKCKEALTQWGDRHYRKVH